jgi:hypothetical protein
MPIIQINLFICEDCGTRIVRTPESEVRLNEDPIVTLVGWRYRETDDKLCCPACLMRGIPETEDPGVARATLKLHVVRLHELLSAQRPEWYANAINREIEAIQILTGPRVATEPLQRP